MRGTVACVFQAPDSGARGYFTSKGIQLGLVQLDTRYLSTRVRVPGLVVRPIVDHNDLKGYTAVDPV
eukprot:6090764-Prymnesium_polylepis.1